MDACRSILAQASRSGVRRMDIPSDPEGPTITAIQSLMHECGVVPFSGSMLLGSLVPGRTVALANADDRVVAAAYTYRPHNRFSPHHGAAWGGLVAVDASERGKGLGTYVNAMMVEAAFIGLDAEMIYELATETNMPSRRMIEACGLHLDPSLKSGVATTGKQRFTR